jgi:diguanylate cyclase (GGDEF)-like protein
VLKRSYAIDPLFAEFEDPLVEAGFREYILDKRLHDTRLAVAVGSMFYVAFAVTDYLNVGATAAYLHILLTRLGVACLGIVVALLARRYWKWLVNGVIPTLVIGCASIGLLGITLHRPFDIGWHGMSMMVLLLGAYVFIPNRFIPALVVALLSSSAFLWLMLLNFRPSPTTILTLITLLAVLNIIGAMAAYRISRMQHEAYLDASVLQEANEALQREMHQREALEEDLRELLDRDLLTGLPNRGCFLPQASDMIEEANLNGRCLAFIVIDIDYFRQINGTYGHSRGDDVLRVLAGRCRARLAGGAICARLGGDDFAIIVPGLELAKALAYADDLRRDIKRAAVDLGDSGLHFTVSMGVARCCQGDNINTLLRRADQALSAAKYNGRDRVEVSSDFDGLAAGNGRD